MPTNDTTVTICPLFKIHEGQVDAIKSLCEQFVAKTDTEAKCLYYGFSFDGDRMFCREGYEGAAGVLAHLENVGALLQEALKIADVERLEIHGLASELAKLKEPLAGFNPTYFELQYGFKR